MLPIQIEAIEEGTLVCPQMPCFKVTNTHPRFFWLPNFVETLLVEVWYPTTIATISREFRKKLMGHSVCTQRWFGGEDADQDAAVRYVKDKQEAAAIEIMRSDEATVQWDVVANKPPPNEVTDYNDVKALNVAAALSVNNPGYAGGAVFDLCDFGYRGVSSHETAGLGSAAYYVSGYEGSDTTAGARMLKDCYNVYDAGNSKKNCEAHFKKGRMTTIPASEHSTVTSWVDQTNTVEKDLATEELASFENMFTQYEDHYACALVSDGFNVWNAIKNQWPRIESVKRRLALVKNGKTRLNVLRPDSGEGFESLPQYMKMLEFTTEVGTQKTPATETPPADVQEGGDGEAEQAGSQTTPPTNNKSTVQQRSDFANGIWNDAKVVANAGTTYKKFNGNAFKILQGDGVDLPTVDLMLSSVAVNGFCAGNVNFGSGGGLMQKVNRDTLSVAFKCCAMYVPQNDANLKRMPPLVKSRRAQCSVQIGKDPIRRQKVNCWQPSTRRNVPSENVNVNPASLKDLKLVNAQNFEPKKQGLTFVPSEDWPATDFVFDAHDIFDSHIRDLQGDLLKIVFKNGECTKPTDFTDILEKARLTVKDIKTAAEKAEQMHEKYKAFKAFTSPERMGLRYKEADAGLLHKSEDLTGIVVSETADEIKTAIKVESRDEDVSSFFKEMAPVL